MKESSETNKLSYSLIQYTFISMFHEIKFLSLTYMVCFDDVMIRLKEIRGMLLPEKQLTKTSLNTAKTNPLML